MWEILGIEPTDDLKKIRAAYSELARKYHPEEHPEEFSKLHDAYRSACEYAKIISSRKGSGASAQPEKFEQIVIIDHARIAEMKLRAEEKHRSISQKAMTEYDFGAVDVVEGHNSSPQFIREKFLRTIRMIADDENEPNSLTAWKWLLEKDDFSYIADDPSFRAEVMKIIGNMEFFPDTASYIAVKFSHGSRAVPLKNNRSMRRVYIPKYPQKGYRLKHYTDSSYNDSIGAQKSRESYSKRWFALLMAVVMILYIFLMIGWI